MKQNEQDIQRFLQIREEIHDEIKKIEPSVVLLQETTKRFVAHFDVFQKLSLNAQEQMKLAITGASHEMAEMVSDTFSERFGDHMQNVMRNLDQSVENAKRILETTDRKNKITVAVISVLAMLLSIGIGFGGGYFYSQKTTYSFSKEVVETYQSGEKLRKALLKLKPNEKLELERILFNK